MEYPNNGAKRIQPREAPENGISRVRKSRKKLKKSSAPQGVTANNKRQVKEMDEEMPSLNDKHIQKLFEFLRREGWTDEKIAKLIEYITQ